MTVYALGDKSPNLPENGDFWIAPDANVIGRVEISEGASIWFGSTLRGDNEPIFIGAGTNIQENCVLHTDPGFKLTVGEGCTIGHKAMLHGCRVGDGTLIGMGATVLNGATVGEGTLVGANALITEGKDIPAGVLVVGSPARVIRELSEKEKAGLALAAEVYRSKMRRYRDELVVM